MTRKIYEGEDASRYFNGSAVDDEKNIVCPYCDSDYSHIKSVGTLTGSDELEAVESYEGTKSVGKTGSRRSAVEILIVCEQCGLDFSLVIQQHKGINYVQIHTDADAKIPHSIDS